MENEKLLMTETDQNVSGELSQKLSYEHDIVLQVANDELNQARIDYEDDLSCAEYRNLLYRITDRVLNSEKLVGSGDEIHNYSVELARRGEYLLAVKVLKKGLVIFPKNTDLIADFLQYSCYCGEQQEALQYYNRLQALPKYLWTWRAFSFSIDFLKNSLESCNDNEENFYNKKRNEMYEIAYAYRDAYPFSEDSYACISDIYTLFGEKAEAQKALEDALSNLKVCPKCAIRLADIYFDRGDMQRALNVINRGLKDSNQAEEKVNTGYLYLLSGLSKTALLYEKEFVAEKKEVISIYEDFNIALEQINHDRFRKLIRNKIIAIKTKTNFEIPDKFESLISLI